MTLNDIEKGQAVVVRAIGGDGALRQHFLDMGVMPGAEVTVVKLAAMGDPMELQVHGYELSLRLADAKEIEIPSDLKSIAEEKHNDLIEAIAEYDDELMGSGALKMRINQDIIKLLMI